MQLPFTRGEFFDVLAAYNSALWPAAVALWMASALACVSLWLRHSHDRWLSGLLAVHWAWSAFAYHIAFFTRINPAAWLFAAVFLLEAALFVWYGLVKGRLSFASPRSAWTPLGWCLIAYALLYPVINAVEQGSVLKSPTFGLPCPTTVFTAGLLLLASSPSRILAVVPIVWGAIGGSAAMLLGVSADYALPIAAAALAAFQLLPPFARYRPELASRDDGGAEPPEGAPGFSPSLRARGDESTVEHLPRPRGESRDAVYSDEQRIYARNLELLAAPAIPPTHGFCDECLKGGVQFSLGFMKPCAAWPFGSATSFGSPGSGGSLGFADPTLGVGYAYVTSQMGTTLTGDPRDVAQREALYSVLPTVSGVSPVAA